MAIVIPTDRHWLGIAVDFAIEVILIPLAHTITTTVGLRVRRAVRTVRPIFVRMALPVTTPLEAVRAISFGLFTADAIRRTAIAVLAVCFTGAVSITALLTIWITGPATIRTAASIACSFTDWPGFFTECIGGSWVVTCIGGTFIAIIAVDVFVASRLTGFHSRQIALVVVGR